MWLQNGWKNWVLYSSVLVYFCFPLAIGCLSPRTGFFIHKQFPHSGVTDPELDKLARYRKSKSGRSGKNAARDFHRYVHRDGKLFGVKVSSFKVPVRKRIRTSSGRRRHKEIRIQHPIILLSSWMEAMFKEYPNFFLVVLTLTMMDWKAARRCLPVFGKGFELASQAIPSTRERRSKGVAQFQ